MPRERLIAALGIAFGIAAVFVHASVGHAQTLRGSLASVLRQRDVAIMNDYTRLETSADISRFVKRGLLVRVRGNVNYELAGVSHPYARPAVLEFIEQISSQYRAGCGEKMVVTSLTRPSDRQPRNASVESVHPAGMAVDLRVSTRTACRKWLERTLLTMEKDGVIEATRERRPAHFHVAVFPNQYAEYAKKKAQTAG